MYQVVAVVVPVFLVAFIGYTYAIRTGMDITPASKLNLDLFVPAILVYALSEKLPEVSGVGPVLLAGMVVVLGSGLLAWPVARMLGLPARMLLPPMMFNNSGNLGLPLAMLAFGESGFPWAVSLFVTATVMHVTLGIVILQGTLDLRALARNPVVLAVLAGVTMYLAGWHFPSMVLDGVKMLADVSIPLMLVSLGFYLAKASLRDAGVGLLGALLCPLTGLLSAWLGSLFIELTPGQLANVYLFAAMPPAVMNSVLAERYGVEPAAVASIVATGNLSAVLVLPAVLFWLLP